MTFYSPSVSFLKKTFCLVLAVLACAVFAASNLAAAPLLILTEPGATAVFKAGAEEIDLGAADADGLLLVPEAPTAAGTLTLSHPDAEKPLVFAYFPEKTSGKIPLKLKLKPASLLISALPAEEVEIFVNGQHKGRGAVTLGGVTPREKVTIEARSARRGIQSRVVSAEPGQSMTVKFDLRGNEVSDRPDGQIVLPELPLVLASQQGAIIKADGAVVDLDAGALRGLEPGSRVVEIFLPWQGREVCVWRAALPARSAMLPGADAVAVPNPVPEPEVPAPAAPVANAIEGEVIFVIGNRATVSLGSDAGLKDGATVPVIFGDAKEPVSVTVSGVTPTQAIFQLPEDAPAPQDGDACFIPKSLVLKN